MYEYLRGTLAAKHPGVAVIEAGGVGYRVLITADTYDGLPAVGGEARLWLHFTLNSDAGEMRFYGFASERERLVFQQLLDVQRVGPALALRILSGAGVDTLVHAIAGADVAALTRLKGVGRKVAERLIVELQAPLSRLGMIANAADPASQGIAGAAAPSAGGAATQRGRDAIAALVSLGYKPAEAEPAVAKAVKATADDAELGEVIRLALQNV